MFYDRLADYRVSWRVLAYILITLFLLAILVWGWLKKR